MTLAHTQTLTDLQWNGQHQAVIDGVTKALAVGDLPPTEQLDLLDLRAESYIAVVDLDAARADAEAMMALADEIDTPAARAHAGNRLARVQTESDDAAESAVTTAATALKHAREAENQHLEAMALFRLADAEQRSSRLAEAMEHATQAVTIFRAIGEPIWQGRALWVYGWLAIVSGQKEQGQQAAETALALARQTGDRWGEGNALNILGASSTDFVHQLTLVQKIQEAFEAVGYRERQLVIMNNLASLYRTLGLLRRAQRLYEQVATDTQAKRLKGHTLQNVAASLLEIGQVEQARQVLEEAESLITNPRMRVRILSLLWSKIAYAEGDAAGMLAHLTKAKKLAEEHGLKVEMAHIWNEIARANLLAGDPVQALTSSAQAISLVQQSQMSLSQDWVADYWWTYYRALQANDQDEEARHALGQAYEALLEPIRNIGDAGLRRSYLNKRQTHREIIAAWMELDDITEERRTAHLKGPDNPREAFARLNDSSLRMNALREVEELYDFILDEVTELSGAERVLLLLEHPDGIEMVRSLVPLGEDPANIELDEVIALARRTRSTHLLHTPEDAAPLEQTSIIIAPLTANNRVSGYLYADVVGPYGRLEEVDRDMLGMLASQGSIALENAGWVETLEGRVEERTEQLNARVEELQIINTIQTAMAAEESFQGIIDLVGDRLREIFETGDLRIIWHNPSTNMLDHLYVYEHGKRLPFVSTAPLTGGVFEQMQANRQPVVLPNVPQYAESVKVSAREVTELPLSAITVPLLGTERILGLISLENYERYNAFGEAEVRLLTTLANAMAIALESAKRFEEIQQRNAELAIINAVQEGLVAAMDIQAIYELVGDKMHDIFAAHDLGLVEIDVENKRGVMRYLYRNNQRLTSTEVVPTSAVTQYYVESKKPILINGSVQQWLLQKGGDPDMVARTFGEEYDPKSGLLVPLRIQDKVTGVVSLFNNEKEQAFGESDVRLLTTVANSMSIALESARRFEEIQQRKAEAEMVNTVQMGLIESTDIDEIYRLVGDKIVEMTEPLGCMIALFDLSEKTSRIHYIYERDVDRQLPAHAMPFSPIQDHLVETGTFWVARTQEELLSMASHYAQPDGQMVEPNNVPSDDFPHSGVFVPMIVSDQVVGYVSLQSESEHAYDENAIRLLQTLTSAMTLALENARLLIETRNRSEQMAALNEVGKDISATLELDTVLNSVTHHATRLVAGDAGAMWLVDEDRKTVKVITAVGDIAEPLQGFVVPYGSGIVGSIIKEGQPSLIEDTNTDPRGVHIEGTRDTGEGERLMVAPLMDGETAIGAMSVWRNPGNPAFEEDELAFLSSLAQQAVIAVLNARLFEEAEEARAFAEESRILAEQASEAKSSFLANMSHELRTPLNAIIGFTRIVKRKAKNKLPDRQIDNLSKVLSSADHLLELINTILDIAKIEAGRMDVTPAETTLATMVNVCVATSQPLLKPGVELTISLADDIPTLYTDANKVRQILLNLLSNAAKFTEEGSVAIKADAVGGYVIIDVIDTGIGMDEESVSKVFDEFQQADNSTTRKYGGTGLGLAISRNLAELLGGSLVATSEVEVGSIFTLTLPVRYAQQAGDATTPDPQVSTRKTLAGDAPTILAIDDDPDAIYMLQESLSEAGYKVVGVSHGEEGLTLAKAIQPFAITLDVMMPDIDGWQILHALKNDERTRHIPVIILSIIDDKPLGYHLGAADYLIKPFEEEAILTTLSNLLTPGGSRLLVVDDDPNVLDMVSQLLEDTPYSIETARDGAEALAKIEAKPPDAMLLDLMMPNVDGFGVLEGLGEHDFPVIVFTAKELTLPEIDLLNASTASVIRKQGLDPNTLLKQLYTVLAKDS